MFLSATRRDGETFRGIHDDNVSVLEALVDRNIPIYYIFLRKENHICWTADINKFLKKFWCYISDQFFDRSFNLLRHMQNWSENTQHKYATGAYQLSETAFSRLEDVNIMVRWELRLFFHLIAFDFESTTVPDNTIRNTKLNSWIGKLVPISVSISSNLLEETTFLCKSDPNQLIRDFVSNLELISQKSAILMKEKFAKLHFRLEEKYWLARDKVPVRENERLVNDEVETAEEDEEDSNSDCKKKPYKDNLCTLRTICTVVFSYNIKHWNWCRCFSQRQGEMAKHFEKYMMTIFLFLRL